MYLSDGCSLREVGSEVTSWVYGEAASRGLWEMRVHWCSRETPRPRQGHGSYMETGGLVWEDSTSSSIEGWSVQQRELRVCWQVTRELWQRVEARAQPFLLEFSLNACPLLMKEELERGFPLRDEDCGHLWRRQAFSQMPFSHATWERCEEVSFHNTQLKCEEPE